MNMQENENEYEFFQKHYIRTRKDSAIIYGFSDAFEQPKTQKNQKNPKHQEDVEQYNDILINDKGSYHFRLIIDSKETHENPWDLIRNEQGIPLLKWDDTTKKIIKRTEEEIQEELQRELQIQEEMQANIANMANMANVANTTKSDRAFKYETGIDEQLEEYTERLEYLEKVIDILVKNAPQKTKAQIVELGEVAIGKVGTVSNGEQHE